MYNFFSLIPPFPLLSILCGAFLGVLFTQSGIDKVMDREGNLGWLKQHFGKSIFKDIVPLLFYTILVFELAAGFVSLGGVVYAAIFLKGTGVVIGAVLSAVSLLFLFTGQRVAKDYAGSAALVPYFILSVVTYIVAVLGV